MPSGFVGIYRLRRRPRGSAQKEQAVVVEHALARCLQLAGMWMSGSWQRFGRLPRNRRGHQQDSANQGYLAIARCRSGQARKRAQNDACPKCARRNFSPLVGVEKISQKISLDGCPENFAKCARRNFSPLMGVQKIWCPENFGCAENFCRVAQSVGRSGASPSAATHPQRPRPNVPMSSVDKRLDMH